MIKRLQSITGLLFILCLNTLSQVATPDTTVIIRAYSIHPETNEAFESEMDTSFRTIHEYNPVFYKSFSSTFLGNTGQAAITNNLAMRDLHHPFLFATPYRFYIYDPYSIQHFNTRKPFTELKYLSSGSRDDSEQVLSALHTQNVNQYTNIGILYDLIASKGIYIDQNTGINRINLFGSYNKDNYRMYSSLHYNGFKFQENGGLANLDNFLSRQSEALNYAMNLDDANSRFRNLNLFYTHSLQLPALATDSMAKVRLKPFSIQHTINYNRFSKNYSDDIAFDDTTSFYSDHFYLLDEADDSAFYMNLSNRIDLNIKLAKSQELKAFIKHEYKSYSYVLPENIQYDLDSITIDTVVRSYPRDRYNDFSVGGIFEGKLTNWEYTASGQIFLSGYQAGDLIAKASFTRYFSQKKYYLNLSGGFSTRKPSYFLNQYGSAHFIWNNDFRNIDNTRASLRFGSKKDFRVHLNLDFYTGYIFFNESALPEQRESEMLTTTLGLYKKFTWDP